MPTFSWIEENGRKAYRDHLKNQRGEFIKNYYGDPFAIRAIVRSKNAIIHTV